MSGTFDKAIVADCPGSCSATCPFSPSGAFTEGAAALF
jgi:hypothetical protein